MQVIQKDLDFHFRPGKVKLLHKKKTWLRNATATAELHLFLYWILNILLKI